MSFGANASCFLMINILAKTKKERITWISHFGVPHALMFLMGIFYCKKDCCEDIILHLERADMENTKLYHTKLLLSIAEPQLEQVLTGFSSGIILFPSLTTVLLFRPWWHWLILKAFGSHPCQEPSCMFWAQLAQRWPQSWWLWPQCIDSQVLLQRLFHFSNLAWCSSLSNILGACKQRSQCGKFVVLLVKFVTIFF